MCQTNCSLERTRWFSIVLGFVAVEATAFSLRGALVPRFIDVFDTTTRLTGLLAPAATAGFVVTLLLTGLVAVSIDTDRLLVTAIAATGLCFLGAAFAPTFGVLLVALFGRGVATGVFRGLDRPLLSTLYDESIERVFNYYDLAWAVGAALAPGISVLAIRTVGWRPVYLALAAGCFGLAAVAHRGRLGLLENQRTDIEWTDIKALAASSRVRLIAATMFLLGGVEGSLFTWLPLYTSRTTHAVSGATALTVLLVAYVPGRFIHASLSTRFSVDRYLVAIASGASVCLLGTLLAAGSGQFLAGIVATGVLMAGLFPTTIALAVRLVPDQAGPLNAGLTAVSYLGIAVWPPLAGHVAYVSDGSLFVVPAVLAFCLAGGFHYVSGGEWV